MIKFAVVALVFAAFGASVPSAALAHSYVSVKVHGDKAKNRIVVVEHGQAVKRLKKGRIYYDGDYATVSRRDRATYVYAYPGVSVVVGSAGGVHVLIGF